ncbi:MAG TPA: 30S ribosomal protein S16 [Candidatus Paceibacterota bacterium]
MLKIRLSRIGKRGQAYFRVVVVEHTKKPKGEYLELLGTYNPHEKILNVKKDRIDYWVSKGAQPSPTVNNLLVNYKIWDRPKVKSWKPKSKATEQGGGSIKGQQAVVPKVEVSKEKTASVESEPEQVIATS